MEPCPVITTYLRALRELLEKTPVFYSSELEQLAELEKEAASESPGRPRREVGSFRALRCLLYGLKEAGEYRLEPEPLLLLKGMARLGNIEHLKQLVGDLLSGALEKRISVILETLSLKTGEMGLMGIGRGLDESHFETLECHRETFGAADMLAKAVRVTLRTKDESEALEAATEAAVLLHRICHLRTVKAGTELGYAKELLLHPTG